MSRREICGSASFATQFAMSGRVESELTCLLPPRNWLSAPLVASGLSLGAVRNLIYIIDPEAEDSRMQGN